MQIRNLLTAALLAIILLLTLAGCSAARPTETSPATAAQSSTDAPARTPAPVVPQTATTPPIDAIPTSAPSQVAGLPTQPLDATPKALEPVETPTLPASVTPTPQEITEPDRSPRDVDHIYFFSPAASLSGASPQWTPPVEQVMEEGWRLSESSPVHLAFRGRLAPDTARCQWRGIARTLAQREEAIRFFLDLDDDAPLPSTTEVERLFDEFIERVSPAKPETTKANFRAITHGGLTTEYLFLICYVDFRVSEYLVGSGPQTIQVAYDQLADINSYGLYRKAQAAGEHGDEALISEAEYNYWLRLAVTNSEAAMSEFMLGRESIVFLAPLGSHAIAVEAWQAVAQWDVQLVDGALQAVRYGAGDHDAEYSQPLATLKSRITTAAATDQFAEKRIASAEGLEAYYREIGAYDDITPGDGIDNPFTPAQPPPVPPCVTGGAVADPGAHRQQVHDCQALLAAQEALGAAALNWSPTHPLPAWDGVTMDGPDGSVVKLDLSGRGLAGVIPPELGWLFGLEELWLRNNRLTGAIPPELGLLGGLQYLVLDGNRLSGAVPAELGELEALEGLRLSGNELSGCLPSGLRAVADSDLAGMGLRYCDRIPPPPTGFRGAPYFSGSVQLNWDAMPGVDAYQVQRLVEGGVGGWYRAGPDLTGILFGNSYNFGLGCGRHYQYRVLSRGDGQTYDAVWSAPSAAISVPTNPCP